MWTSYLTIRGGSLKNIAKNIIPSVPISKKVYTNASIEICNFNKNRKVILKKGFLSGRAAKFCVAKPCFAMLAVPQMGFARRARWRTKLRFVSRANLLALPLRGKKGHGKSYAKLGQLCCPRQEGGCASRQHSCQAAVAQSCLARRGKNGFCYAKLGNRVNRVA